MEDLTATAGRRSGRPSRVGAAVVGAALVCGAVAAGAAPASAAGPSTSTSTTASTSTAAANPLGYDPATNTGSMYAIEAMTGAHTAFKAGWTGKGVDVALLDTGVAPVQGLTSGNVVNGPDLSIDSQEPNLQANDGFGHGTHLASIIVGRDQVQTSPAAYVDSTRFVGMAPDARLVNVKVGSADGGVDVTQVLAGINWVIEHRRTDGLNIRVLNLSYGTDSTQPYQRDLLAYAVERAWKAGIVVVVAGGNDSNTNDYLADPAQEPLVLAVGADDPMGTLATKDDTVPSWASKGGTSALSRHVDLVAPGVHVLGLRAPGSSVDVDNPGARTGSRFLRGNGTSQAAAVVSGAAALYLQKYPAATPDQVKKGLMNQSVSSTGAAQVYRGAGVVNVGYALGMALPTSAAQNGWDPATGSGTLDASRGTSRVVDYPDDATSSPLPLSGDRDVYGGAFDSAAWAAATASGSTWSGGLWMGRPLTGDGFTGTSWAGRTWSGRTWSGLDWAGRTWSGRTWSGRTWSGGTWDGASWSGRTWSGRTWSGRTWSGDGWAGVAWQ